MDNIWIVLVVAAIPAGASVFAALLSSNKTRALIELKMENLTEKVNKHNNLVERMYKVENRCDIFETIVIERRGYDRED